MCGSHCASQHLRIRRTREERNFLHDYYLLLLTTENTEDGVCANFSSKPFSSIASKVFKVMRAETGIKTHKKLGVMSPSIGVPNYWC